jgi:hypothetical protein
VTKYSPALLDLLSHKLQTLRMAHTYMVFDFGTDEEKAQLARHKLEGWKQAFRLDKKMQFKFERGESASAESGEVPPKTPKSKPKSRAKSDDQATPSNGDVKLLLRLYFSAHEKLSEQRWFDRIPAEEPFKGTPQKIIRDGENEFSEIDKQFESLE